MPGLTLATTDDFGNEYPNAFWTVTESHLYHTLESGNLVIDVFKDVEAHAEGKSALPNRARTYSFLPTEQNPVVNDAGEVIRSAVPAFSAFFSREQLSSGNDIFAAIYIWLLSLPEFAGAGIITD